MVAWLDSLPAKSTRAPRKLIQWIIVSGSKVPGLCRNSKVGCFRLAVGCEGSVSPSDSPSDGRGASTESSNGLKLNL